MSRRSLERHFDRALRCSPSTCYIAMRLDQAELLLRTTARTVAAATGFCDTSHLARALKRHRAIVPTDLRRTR